MLFAVSIQLTWILVVYWSVATVLMSSCGVHVPAVSGQEYLPFLDVKTDTPTDSKDLVNHTSSMTARLRQLPDVKRTMPQWEENFRFEFEQFADVNRLNAVKKSMLGVVLMLQTAMDAMFPDRTVIGDLEPGQWLQPKSNPSLDRYFYSGDIAHVAEVFMYLLNALGAPGYENADCHDPGFNTMKIVYGDYEVGQYEGTVRCDSKTPPLGYMRWLDEQNTPTGTLAVMSICELFFQTYKDFEPIPLAMWIADNIEPNPALPRSGQPGYASAQLILHEMLHWRVLGVDVLGYGVGIIDVKIVPPGRTQSAVAYGAFGSMKMKDYSWNIDRITPLLNVDNYVFAVVEIWIRFKTNRESWWNDPADPSFAVQNQNDLDGNPTEDDGNIDADSE